MQVDDLSRITIPQIISDRQTGGAELRRDLLGLFGTASTTLAEALFPFEDKPLAMNLKQIGVIHSPYKTRAEAPFQGRHSSEVCEVEVFDEFLPGLADVEGCTHLILLRWLDQAERMMLKAFPPYDRKEHGVFANEAP